MENANVFKDIIWLKVNVFFAVLSNFLIQYHKNVFQTVEFILILSHQLEYANVKKDFMLLEDNVEFVDKDKHIMHH